MIVSSATKLKLRSAREDRLLAYCPKPLDCRCMLEAVRNILAEAQRVREEIARGAPG